MTRASFVALAALLFSGCLTHGYRVSQDELVRLSQLPPDQRWQAIRVAQTAGGDDNGPPPAEQYTGEAPPEESDPALPPSSHPYAATQLVLRAASGESHGLPLPAHRLLPPRLPAPPGVTGFGPHGHNPLTSLFSGGGSGSGHGGSSSSSARSGNVGEAAVVLVAAAVVVGTVAVVAMGVALGTRYEGWLAVNPDEPVYVWTANRSVPYSVPLSALTPELAANASAGMLYEIDDGRYFRVATAPLDRSGLGITAGVLGGGFLMANNSIGTGLGLHLNLGANIANLVSIGLSLDTASASAAADSTALLANIGPEIELFPIRWFGFYTGAGYSYRTTYASSTSGARSILNVSTSDGFYARAGIEAEIPLFTRMGFRVRTGAVRWDYSGVAAYSWEASAGIAVY